MSQLVRLSNTTRMSKLIIDPPMLGNFNQFPIEILNFIISKFDLNDIVKMNSLCHSFRAITFPFFEYTVLCFSDPSKLQPDLTEFYNASKKLIHPHRFPKVISIEPERLMKLCRTEPLLRNLVLATTCYEELPPQIDTSMITCLILSSDGFVDANQVLKFLETHQFPNVKAMSFYGLSFSRKLRDYCSEKFQLEHLFISQCPFNDCAWSEYSFDFVQEFVITLEYNEENRNCGTMFALPINVEKCVIHLSEKNNTLCRKPFNLSFYAMECKRLKYL